ncbi:hypothetical protein BOTCAL_0198g00030 [Botryotinia calthae]|uniref:Uncharacterized protein n=1 Tax=Botryotinia calthae TaxID=38488 RepID=A0A4Y8D023_9HELO|nr:hypothetical protein BOTCAL_0198g00030 [Botryotinia calthae]
MIRKATLREKKSPLPMMPPDTQSKVESEAKVYCISEKVEKVSNNKAPMNLYLIVRSHVFEIPKDIAINASKIIAKTWSANPTARRITFTVEDKDGDDNDPDPEHFYTVDVVAHLVGCMYGNELRCPTSDIDRHSGCLVAWCKAYKLARYLEMEEACEGVLARIAKCLGERKFHREIPTRKEVVEIYGMTGEGSDVREALVDAMAKMGKLWNVVGEGHTGDTRDCVENWLRSSSVLKGCLDEDWRGGGGENGKDQGRSG